MNAPILSRVRQAVTAFASPARYTATKALSQASHPVGNPLNFGYFPNSKIDWERLTDPILNSVVAAGVYWYADMFPEAQVTVMRENPEGDDERLIGHELARLWENPNPFYSGDEMAAAAMIDWWLDGNVYLQVIESNGGQPAQLWYTPANLVEPKWPIGSPDVYVSHYEYRDGVTVHEWAPESVIHLRNGIDPRNTRKGQGRLKAVLREIFTDDEASNFIASVLRNHAVPGIIVTPKPDAGFVFDDASAKTTKEVLNRDFTGDQRGSTAVLNGPIELHRVSWSPSELDLSRFRNVTEERVSSVMGLNAAVLNLGTGLEAVNVGATMTAYVKLAWQRGMRPVQRRIGAQLTRQLLPLYRGTTDADAVVFDTSKVPALEEDAEARDRRAVANYRGQIWTRGEARVATGRVAEDNDDVFVIGISETLVSREATVEDIYGPAEPGDTDPVTDPATEPGAKPEPTTEPVQSLALNGAQISSLLTILTQVTLRELSPDTARALLTAAFPSLPAELVGSMVESADSFEPEAAPDPEPTPPPPGNAPPGAEPEDDEPEPDVQEASFTATWDRKANRWGALSFLA